MSMRVKPHANAQGTKSERGRKDGGRVAVVFNATFCWMLSFDKGDEVEKLESRRRDGRA